MIMDEWGDDGVQGSPTDDRRLYQRGVREQYVRTSYM